MILLSPVFFLSFHFIFPEYTYLKVALPFHFYQDDRLHYLKIIFSKLLRHPKCNAFQMLLRTEVNSLTKDFPERTSKVMLMLSVVTPGWGMVQVAGYALL